ncbi:uncharacterized protein LOC109705628 [Ananas comosus]|uniref:Uncharacterized protein LOC109705628 n=1 Tax=Ananas comosus TaxID=4615 RepID=A0A6P5EEZ9_ANACO|nr:uncharacterized protein LOC109705628 [Ananas comosus]
MSGGGDRGRVISSSSILSPTASDGDGRDLREEDEENDDNSENAGEEEETYLSDGVEEEDDDSDFGENILNGLEDSAVVEDCSWSVSTVITKEYVLVAQIRDCGNGSLFDPRIQFAIAISGAYVNGVEVDGALHAGEAIVARARPRRRRRRARSPMAAAPSRRSAQRSASCTSRTRATWKGSASSSTPASTSTSGTSTGAPRFTSPRARASRTWSSCCSRGGAQIDPEDRWDRWGSTLGFDDHLLLRFLGFISWG